MGTQDDKTAHELSVESLELNDNEAGALLPEDEHNDAVRKSLLQGSAEAYLATLEQHKLLPAGTSPLQFLMEWFHMWQREYDAFVHVLENDEEEDDTRPSEDDPSVAGGASLEKELQELEEEAGQLLQGFSQIVAALLEMLQIEQPDTVVDKFGWTLLMQAANTGLRELMGVLIDKNVDVNYGGTNKDGSNPLYLAIESEHTQEALVLLKNGAIASATKVVKTHKPSIGEVDAAEVDEEEEEELDCALFQACRFGHLIVIEEMIALGVDLNFALPSTGDRALHVATMFEMHDVVELLLSNESVQVNAKNLVGQTCLFGCSNLELAHLLVAKGADPKIKDSDDETAWSVATALGDTQVAQYLKGLTV